MSVDVVFNFDPSRGNVRQWEQALKAATTVPSNNSVSTDILKDGSVTTVKIGALAVTSAKIATGAISSEKIADSAVTVGKLAAPGVDNEFLVQRSGGLTYGLLLDADIPASLARDAEVTAAIAALSSVYAAIQTTGTYTGAFTGTTTDPAPTLRWSKIGSIVTLYVPQTSATSNATSFTITGAPAAIQPARAQLVQCIVRDNGTVSAGTASMGTSGTLTLGLGLASGNFTGSGTKGVELQSLTFSLD